MPAGVGAAPIGNHRLDRLWYGFLASGRAPLPAPIFFQIQGRAGRWIIAVRDASNGARLLVRQATTVTVQHFDLNAGFPTRRFHRYFEVPADFRFKVSARRYSRGADTILVLCAPGEADTAHGIVVFVISRRRKTHLLALMNRHIARKDLQTADLRIAVRLFLLSSGVADALTLKQFRKAARAEPEKKAHARLLRD